MEQKVFRSSQRRKVPVKFLKVSVFIFFSKMDMEIRMQEAWRLAASQRETIATRA